MRKMFSGRGLGCSVKGIEFSVLPQNALVPSGAGTEVWVVEGVAESSSMRPSLSGLYKQVLMPFGAVEGRTIKF